MTPDDAPATLPDPGLELDVFLAAFEAAASDGRRPDPAEFLPPPSHPLYSAVLRELLRVDLEFAWSRGGRPRVEDYRDRFPDLFRDPDAVRDLAGEEYRLRKAAGEHPDPREYRDRLGVAVAGSSVDSLTPTRLGGAPSEWPADRAPDVGDTIPPGYHLAAQLGRGAFGRVFLARETDLGGRAVAVKVSARSAGEPLTLARLQHTNIVPVYAAHKVGRFTAQVMPFLGRTTLADLIAALRDGRTPQSGRGMVSTLAEHGRSTAGVPAEPAPAEPAPAPGVSRATLDALERMTFVEAVLWVGAELADGLAHAHDRGVLHRDVKPANVLLTDDGRPMLLDFNLAAAATDQLAGTPAYMAPEQLESALADRGVGSPRTDVYALGVVLVELLTGRHPFAEPAGGWERALPEMIAARRRPLAEVTFPPAATPGVRAILAKCLAPDPAERYSSAADLREDLNRQRTHRPLRFAREGSVRERVQKWTRRHPRLSSGAVLVTFAALVVGGVTAAFLARQRHLGLLEAESARAGVREVRELAQAGLAFGPAGTVGEWKATRSAAGEALGPYRVERDDWFRDRLVTRLPEPERTALRRDVGEVMFRTAEATAALAASQSAERPALLEEAAEWNRRARVAFPGTPPPPFVAQEARILRRLGRDAEADRAQAAAEHAPAAEYDTAGAGFDALLEKRWSVAAERLRKAARTETPRYAVWMGLAAAEGKLGRLAAQIDALSAASALRPASPWPFYHRGVARLELNDPGAAVADFDRFLELKPDDADGLLNRAAARYRVGDHRGAVADLDRAEPGTTRTRLWALRSEAKRALGDAAGADRDRAAFLGKTPTDPLSCTVRGEFKRDSDPPDASGALKDFDAALDLDAEFLPALRNKAHLLAEDPARIGEALRVLDAVLRLAPTSVEDRAGRAVLLARLGRTADARGEVEACAAKAADGMTCYQLASAALVAGDKPRGLALLRTALRKDPALAAGMPTDPDLKSVWQDPVFLNLTAAAGALKPQLTLGDGDCVTTRTNPTPAGSGSRGCGGGVPLTRNIELRSMLRPLPHAVGERCGPPVFSVAARLVWLGKSTQSPTSPPPRGGEVALSAQRTRRVRGKAPPHHWEPDLRVPRSYRLSPGSSFAMSFRTAPRTRLGVEALEAREVPAQFGNPWADPTHLTLSFAPDGTRVLGIPSGLRAALGTTLSEAAWQKAVLRAVQTWSQVANINVGVVGDGGEAFGVTGSTERDPRFGDIRVGGVPMGVDALAAAVPPDPFVSGTLAGDVFFNTSARFTAQTLQAVALHEVGHALGLAPSTDPASVMFNASHDRLTLAPSDVTAIRALYGTRAADANEGSNGNNTPNRATRVREPGSYDGYTPLVAFGDVTTPADVDVFEVRNADDYRGPITFRLQTTGVSLLAAKLTVTDDRGRVLATATGSGVAGGVLTVTLKKSARGGEYFATVQAAGNAASVGRYGLGVTFDSLLRPTATTLSTVLKGPYDSLREDEIEELFTNPGGAIYNDDGGEDDDPGQPGELPPLPGFRRDTRYGTTASLASAAEVDHYTVRAPETAGGTAVLTATVRAVGPNGTTPRVEVFDDALNPMPATILANGNGTFAVQVVGVRANEDYVLRVAGASAAGNYDLDVSFLVRAAEVRTFSSGSLNAGRSLSSTLYVGRSQAFGLSLAATGPAGATVNLSVLDSAGRTVFTLAGRAGDTVTGPTALLAPGRYTLRLTATGPSGVVGFTVGGGVITDPVGPRPVKSVAAPQYQDPVTPTAFLYPDGTQTADPFLWLSWFQV